MQDEAIQLGIMCFLMQQDDLQVRLQLSCLFCGGWCNDMAAMGMVCKSRVASEEVAI